MALFVGKKLTEVQNSDYNQIEFKILELLIQYNGISFGIGLFKVILYLFNLSQTQNYL